MTARRGRLADDAANEVFFAMRRRICAEMDEFYRENPQIPTVLLKSRLHKKLGEAFEPVIFAENPFFFEMGLREGQSWGLSALSPAHWLTET